MYSQASKQPDVFEMILSSMDDSRVNAVPSSQHTADWHSDHREGELAVDVVDAKEHIVVVSTIAGAVTDQIEVYVHNDLLTIRGHRKTPLTLSEDEHYLYQECFWGTFSRTIVLPVDVKGDLAAAEYKNGVLTIRIPKTHSNTKIPVTVVDE